MTKTIDTLVRDMEVLISKGKEDIPEEKYAELGKAVADKVKKHLTKSKEPVKRLRMSNIGKGKRYLWYIQNVPESELPKQEEQFEPARLFAFLYGDVIEELLFWFAEQAGHVVTERQATASLLGITGSKDGRIDGVGVDTKSAADRSFQKFSSGTLAEDDVYGYLPQLGGYFHGEDKAAFLVANKSTGEICLDVHTRDGDLPDTKKIIEEVLESGKQPEPPAERCYPTVKSGPGESRVLGAHCSRCPFKFPCYSDANDGAGLRSFAYAGGTKYYVHLDGKQPTVPELDMKGKRIDDEPSLLTKIP